MIPSQEIKKEVIIQPTPGYTKQSFVYDFQTNILYAFLILNFEKKCLLIVRYTLKKICLHGVMTDENIKSLIDTYTRHWVRP